MSEPTTVPESTLGSTALQRFIDHWKVDAEIIPLGAHTATVADAAQALGVDTNQIIKTLVFRCNDETLLVITNGLARVDRKKLAALLGVGRKKVKFASADEALDITGYVVGSMPPFGHRMPLRTFVDPSVMALDTVFGGGGDIDAMMRITPAELIRATGAQTAPVSDA